MRQMTIFPMSYMRQRCASHPGFEDALALQHKPLATVRLVRRSRTQRQSVEGPKLRRATSFISCTPGPKHDAGGGFHPPRLHFSQCCARCARRWAISEKSTMTNVMQVLATANEMHSEAQRSPQTTSFEMEIAVEGDLVLPRSALNRSFDAMDTSQKGFVTCDEFEQFFEPFVIQSVDFEKVMLAVILKIAIGSRAYGPVESALRYEHSEVMSTIRHQHNEGKDHTMPAADTMFQAAWERLGVQDKTGSLEDEILLQARELQDSFANYCSDLYRIMPAVGP